MTVWAVLLLAVSCLPVSGQGKTRYNVWAKEKVRYHHAKVQHDPYNPELRVLLANAYHEDGNDGEAARQLERALELDPNYAEAHCNLGVVRQAQSRFGEAEEQYRLALARDSTMVEAMAGLGTLLCARGRHGEGIEFLERTLIFDPGRDHARYNLGVAYYKAGDFRRSIVHLETLVQRWAEYPGGRRALSESYFARGLTLLQAKQPERALEFFSRSEALQEDADVRFAEGLAHLRLGDLGAAERAFASAVDLDGEHVPALQNLAQVLDQTGRPEEAEVYYRKVAVLAPYLNTIEAARNATYDESYLFE